MLFRKASFIKGFERLASSFVLTEQHGAVFSIQLNRPEVRNAVNNETAIQLRQAFRQFENDVNSRVAVLSSSSGIFCGGYDLKEVSKRNIKDVMEVFKAEEGPMGPTREHFSKPIIAAISGYAVGGGMELSLLCDLRVVEEDAVMGFFNRRWGVPLVDGGTVRLGKLIGLSRALDLILTGRPVNATEAYNFGLANRIVSKGTAYKEAFALANQIAAFPQLCLNEERESTYYAMFNATSLDDALKFEKENSKDCLMEAIRGAGRFAGGAGRAGTFEDYDKHDV